MKPNQDLPFSVETIRYIGRRLQVAGIKPDRPWLEGPMSGSDVILLEAHAGMLRGAQNAIPKSAAQWELADFYRYVLPPAVFDLQSGVLRSFPPFSFLYERLLGPQS